MGGFEFDRSREGVRRAALMWMPRNNVAAGAGSQLRDALADAIARLRAAEDRVALDEAIRAVPDAGRTVLKAAGAASVDLLPVVAHLDSIQFLSSPHVCEGSVTETDQGLDVVRGFLIDELQAVIDSLDLALR